MPASTGRASSRRYRILIVEDYAIERAGLSTIILSVAEFDICGQAATPEEAVLKAREVMPDLMIVELHQGYENQAALVRELSLIEPRPKILVMGEHDQEAFAPRWIRQGASAYVCKDRTVSEIIEAIHKVLRESDEAVFVPTEDQKELPLHRLTARELEVFYILGSGVSTSAAAEKLHVSTKTIESHREKIKMKLEFQSFNQFMHHAVEWYLRNRETRGEISESSAISGAEGIRKITG